MGHEILVSERLKCYAQFYKASRKWIIFKDTQEMDQIRHSNPQVRTAVPLRVPYLS